MIDIIVNKINEMKLDSLEIINKINDENDFISVAHFGMIEGYDNILSFIEDEGKIE